MKSKSKRAIISMEIILTLRCELQQNFELMQQQNSLRKGENFKTKVAKVCDLFGNQINAIS